MAGNEVNHVYQVECSQVSEEMDKAEKLIKEAEAPLKLAKFVVAEARRLPNLPQYIDMRLISLVVRLSR